MSIAPIPPEQRARREKVTAYLRQHFGRHHLEAADMLEGYEAALVESERTVEAQDEVIDTLNEKGPPDPAVVLERDRLRALLREAMAAVSESIGWHGTAIELAEDMNLEQGDVEDLQNIVERHTELCDRIEALIGPPAPPDDLGALLERVQDES